MNDQVENNEIWITDFTIEKSIEYRDRILKYSMSNPDIPIILYINSYGGEAAALMNILDTLDSIPNEVITVASGTAMSCGAYLFMRGVNRYIGPNTSLMFHRVSSMNLGTDLDQLSTAEYTNLLSRHMQDLTLNNLASRGSVQKDKENAEKIKKALESNVDFYVDAKQAVELGLAHKVSVPRVAEQKVLILDGGLTEDEIPVMEEEPVKKKTVTKKIKKGR